MYTFVNKVPTIPEYLYLIATLRYSNEMAMQFYNIQINKYVIVFVRY